MNTFRNSIAYRVLALFLLAACLIGLTFTVSASTSEEVSLTTAVNGFSNMAGSNLTVSYIWDDNDTDDLGIDITMEYGAYGSADAKDDVITIKACGWNAEGEFSGHTTLTLTMTNDSGEPKTLEFILTKVTVGGSVVVNLDGTAQAEPVDGKYSLLLEADKSVTVVLTTAVDATTMNEIQLSGLSFTGEASATAMLTVEDAPDGTAQASGEFPADTGTVTGLAATYDQNAYRFIGWKNKETGTIVSTSASEITGITGSMTVYPFCVPKDYPVFKVGTVLYYYWEDAFDAAMAASDKTVIVYKQSADSGTLPAEASKNVMGDYVTDEDGDGNVTYIIPSGCKLLIPYSASDTGCFEAMPENTHASKATRPSTYYILNLASGATMVCNGEMNVNGQRDEIGQTYTAGPMGSHARLNLQGTGTQLTVNGTLYCYGFVTGTGTTEVNGALYEMLQLADFAGGSFSLNWSSAEANDNPELFLLTQFYIQNVEAPLRVNHTAILYITSIVNISETPFPNSAPLIGEGGLFILGDNAYVERTIGADERMEYNVGGGAITFGELEVKLAMPGLGTEYTINSSDHVLPLPSMMTVNVVDKATVTMGNAMALMPGARITVDSTSSVTLSNKLYVFDKADWSSTYFYQAGRTNPIMPVYYNTTRGAICENPDANNTVPAITLPAAVASQANNSGYLKINGTLTVTSAGGVYTTSGGSNTDKILRGTGTVTNGGSLTYMTEYDVRTDESVFGSKQKQYKFAESNKLYLGYATESVLVGESYVWVPLRGDTWPDVNKDFVANTVTVDSVIANYAAVGKLKAMPATGTYYGIIDVDGVNWWYINKTGEAAATCTEKGYIVANCGSGSQNIFISNPLGHSWGNWTETTAATCEADGVETRTCSRCGETETQPIPMLGHAWGTPTYEWIADGTQCTATRVCTRDTKHVETETKGEVTDSKAPTCTDAGYTKYTADFVNDAFETKINTVDIEALGHSYESVVTAPTCTSGGYTTYTCACGDSYKDDEVVALGHTPAAAVEEKRKNPTFDDPGSYDSVVYCETCGSEISRETIITTPAKVAAAQIDNTKYEFLQEALDTVIEGDTIVLLKDKSEGVVFGKCITLDISKVPGYKINCAEGYEAVDKGDGIYLIHNTSLFDLLGSSLKAGDSLDLYFYVSTEDVPIADKGNYKAVITRYRQGVLDTNIITILGEEWQESSDMLRFCYDGIAGKEMTDKVFVAIYEGNTLVSNVRMETVANYAYRILTKTVKDAQDGTKDAALRTTLVDMLNYGAGCQQIFDNYNGDLLANAAIDDYQKYATPSVSYNNDMNCDLKYFAGSTVSARNKLMYTFYFNFDPTGYTAEISYKNHYGTPVNATITTFRKNGNNYGVDVTGLAVADGRQTITCVLKDSNGAVTTTATGSVEDYVASAMASSSDDKTVFENLLKFVDSAYAYFHFEEET